MHCYCGKRKPPNPQNASHVRDGHSLCSAACARAYDVTAGVVINAIIEGGHDEIAVSLVSSYHRKRNSVSMG